MSRLPDGVTVNVEAIPHGGLAVVIAIPVGADAKQAADLARDIRNGEVDLSDLEWRR